MKDNWCNEQYLNENNDFAVNLADSIYFDNQLQYPLI